MPTRHLSDEQRQRYANFTAAPSPDQLAQYFHLDRSDREVLDGLRGDHNRLGFALMLGSARFLGVFPGADLVERISEQADRADRAARTATRAAWVVMFAVVLAAVGACGFWLAGVIPG